MAGRKPFGLRGNLLACANAIADNALKGKRMKRRVKKAAVTALTIVCFSVVCAVSYAEDADTWGAVTRLSQIAGHWEGAVTYEMPADEDAMTPAMSMDVSVSLWYEEGAREMEAEVRVDFSRFLEEWALIAGVDADMLWEILSMGFKDGEDAMLESDSYALRYTQVLPMEEDAIINEGGMLINGSGTKLRFAESSQVELADFPFSQFIMSRK
jgi:hypothetical protein